MNLTHSNPVVDELWSTRTIRQRCQLVFSLAEQNNLQHFRLNKNFNATLNSAALFVKQEILHNYADLKIPFHTRYRHFEAGRTHRIARLTNKLRHLNQTEILESLVDLVVVSVLLDAGAGEQWRYRDDDGQFYSHSEGLAVAGFNMFCAGIFSSDKSFPYRVDALALERLPEEQLANGFQHTSDNVLSAFGGRLALLKQLARVLHGKPVFFGNNGRIGKLIYYFQQMSPSPSATDLLRLVLFAFAEIWRGGVMIEGQALGDVWRYSPLLGDSYQGLIPFHKLSQWLTYSLVEPLMDAGFEIHNIDALTGLPEYRNGGLFLDLQVVELKNPELTKISHRVDSDLVIEWRALTVVLLDKLAGKLQTQMGLKENELPLAKVLQGGTWSAGRKIAEKLRPGGAPPLQIISDGTVF